MNIEKIDKQITVLSGSLTILEEMHSKEIFKCEGQAKESRESTEGHAAEDKITALDNAIFAIRDAIQELIDIREI